MLEYVRRYILGFGVEQNDGDSKKQKTSVCVDESCDGKPEIGTLDQKKQLPEPPKDYIHVRARRGQATDSHSLAERVRMINTLLIILLF